MSGGKGTFSRPAVWYLQGMIVGIGVDLEEVGRIRGAIERHGDRFLRRIFTPDEVAYAEEKAQPFSSYAARFAAKEAAMKALGTGWDHGVRWRDIEVANESGGRPLLRLRGRAAEVARELGLPVDSRFAFAYAGDGDGGGDFGDVTGVGEPPSRGPVWAIR